MKRRKQIVVLSLFFMLYWLSNFKLYKIVYDVVQLYKLLIKNFKGIDTPSTKGNLKLSLILCNKYHI